MPGQSGEDDDTSEHQPVSIRNGWRARLFRGLRALEDGDLSGALEHFEAALRLERRPEVCYALAREHARAARHDRAEALFREAWADGGGLLVAAAALARLLGVGQGRLEEASAVLEDAIARFPDEPNLLIVRGELCLESEDAHGARICFETALARGGDVAAGEAGLSRAFNSEGISLGEAGDDHQALFAFKRAAGLDPGWSGPLVNMGVVFARLGRTARAEWAYEAALRVDPENTVALFNLGNLQRDLGDPRAARKAWERALELDPEHRGASGALADLYGAEGDFTRAASLFQAELARDPDSARGWGNLGLAQACAGDEAAAERSLRRALELDPGQASACFHLALLFSRQGRYADAAEMTRRAFELDPERARTVFGQPAGPDTAPRC